MPAATSARNVLDFDLAAARRGNCRQIQNSRHVPHDEPDGEQEFPFHVDFSHHVAELHRMLGEESRATIPFVAILLNIHSPWRVAMRMTVADLMCETPVTLGPTCTADTALEAIYEFEVSELYIVDKSGRFLGILPDYEVLKTQLSGEASLLRVEQLMSRNVPFVTPTTDAAEVARKFRESHCSRLAVVKSGRLVGVITRSDVLRLMIVMRRVDSSEIKSTTGPKQPRFLSSPDRSTTRTSRAKTLNQKSAAKKPKSLSASRRVTSRSGR